MNHENEEYGEERLLELILSSKNLSSNIILGNIVMDVEKFDTSDAQNDDRTLMIIKVK